eukprot:sb/3470257/
MTDYGNGTVGQYIMPVQNLYIAALAALSIAIVIGNILVLITFGKDKSLRNSTGLIIISLAVCDMITGSLAVPSVILTMIEHPSLAFMRKAAVYIIQLPVNKCVAMVTQYVAMVTQPIFQEYASFAAFMTWFNSLLNPIIYWYFNKRYSAEMRKSLKRGAKLVKSLSSKALLTGIPRMSLSTAGATAYSPVQEEGVAPISVVPGSEITPA